jgi:uncharacterized damage-inducible protein DinB
LSCLAWTECWEGFSRDCSEEQLAAWAEEAGQLWEGLLAEPDDPERGVVDDDGALEVRAGVIFAQALHHGNAHREQICTTLTSLGVVLDLPLLSAALGGV